MAYARVETPNFGAGGDTVKTGNEKLSNEVDRLYTAVNAAAQTQVMTEQSTDVTTAANEAPAKGSPIRFARIVSSSG